ncbi:MAG: glycoside hydrolase family 3 protein [Bacteroidales bacterium]|nr:glycoside hydrolase family 3 protein [Bacteroidales bacterium]
MKNTLFCSGLIAVLFVQCTGKYVQPALEARNVQIIAEEKYQFKDLNKNGELDPYEDWRLPLDERIDNLVSLMTLEEKAGLMFHPNLSVAQDAFIAYDTSDEMLRAAENNESVSGIKVLQLKDSARAKSFIEEKNFRCILNNGVAGPKVFAEWSNYMQEIAEGSRLGIPVMFSSDPRHGAELGAHVKGAQYFSQWPSREGQYGITASRNPDLVKKFGEVTAEEYRAVGLHMILGPQIDVTTEPRWRRNSGSFSESAELTAEMLEAYMDGAQGSSVGPDKILVMLKHWPGAGPHKGGEGDWLVYPGDNLEYHLIPWKTGIAKGALSVMGFYSGTYFDTLGVNFSKYISTEVLYNQLGFEGSICTDWHAISRKGALRNDLIGIPLNDRFEMSINAGVDQFGGETIPERIVELVHEGKIPESRIDLAASRILQWHFMLGLFEDPYVDPEAAKTIVRSEKNQQLGYQAQLESIVLLSNSGILPFSDAGDRIELYISGIDSTAASQYGNIAEYPDQADLAILRVSSASGRTPDGTQNTVVNIEFPEVTMDMISEVAATGVPVVVIVNLERTLVVLPEELFSVTGAIFMAFDVLDNALLDVIFGKFNPVGNLPFELPSSMEAVRNQLEDVPFDSKDPLYEFGFGLSYD